MSSYKDVMTAQFEMSENKRKQEREDSIRKQQYKHDWKIAFFNAIAGGIAGLVTSIIFWLITK